MNCTPKVGYQSNSWVLFMTKYDEDFKKSVVQDYLGDGGGQPSVFLALGAVEAKSC